jgi:hypothetical protein
MKERSRSVGARLPASGKTTGNFQTHEHIGVYRLN